jgi:glycosyltransferase involved in cell wall biosynthesis
MRIGIDIQSTAGAKTGIGYYTYNLVKRLSQIEGIGLTCYKPGNKEKLNTAQRIFWENIKMPMLAKTDKIELLHIPGFAGAFSSLGIKKITTVHDLIGMIYPWNLGPASRFYWQKWLAACVSHSDFIIADSENTKKDIINYLKFPSEKIKVIYLASDPVFRPLERSVSHDEILRNYGITKKYILNVGTIEPRKNISSLIVAFNAYLKKSKRKDLLLVIAGQKGWDYEKCLFKVVELGLEDKVLFCGYIKDEDFPVVYNYAQAFIYPSLYEGFGLPVLEAMSCGLPVICSKVSSLPEITQDSVRYIDPKNLDSVVSALENVLDNVGLRSELGRRALEQSKKFSWDRTILETISVYENILK